MSGTRIGWQLALPILNEIGQILTVCKQSSHDQTEFHNVLGLYSLTLLGVDHRDVSIGNVLLGTDPEKATGFISDFDLPSISEEAIKAAYPNDHDNIINQMKDGEWRTVCDHDLESAWTACLYNLVRRELHFSWLMAF